MADPFAFGTSSFGATAFGAVPPSGWDFSRTDVTFDNLGYTFDGGAPVAPPPPALAVTATQADIVNRLQRLMPNGWFSNGASPLRDAILTGFANAFAFVFSALAYVRLQTRIATATDGWLDLIAFDFFGGDLPRAAGQTDTSYRYQIISFMFRQRNTRQAIVLVVQQLLKTTPTIIEPQRVTDTGAYDIASSLAYDVPGAGVWGDDGMPLQCFVNVTVPNSLSIAPPSVAGYGIPTGAYGIGQIEYIGAPAANSVQIADIYAAISSVLPVTGVAWVGITAGQ